VKNKTLFEKIKTFFVRRNRAPEASSSFAKKISNNKQSYKNNTFETGTRKKSLLEKWRIKRAERPQQKSNLSLGGNREARKRTPLKAILAIGIALSGAYMFVTGPMQSLYGNLQYFRIHEIEISGCVMTSPAALRQFANISYEMNMLTIDPASLKKRLEEHPWVVGATIRRIWPDGLNVTISEYRPQALIVQEGKDGFEYLDRKGVVFAKVVPGQEIDFPVITGLDSFDTEAERRELLDAATLFLRLVSRNNPNLPAQNISEMHFESGGELTLYLVEHPFPIYFGKGEIKRKYYQLRKVLEVLYQKKKGVSMIEEVVYIRMDYQKDKVLVAKNQAG
jgi:cell division protein FtsQ